MKVNFVPVKEEEEGCTALRRSCSDIGSFRTMSPVAADSMDYIHD